MILLFFWFYSQPEEDVFLRFSVKRKTPSNWIGRGDTNKKKLPFWNMTSFIFLCMLCISFAYNILCMHTMMWQVYPNDTLLHFQPSSGGAVHYMTSACIYFIRTLGLSRLSADLSIKCNCLKCCTRMPITLIAERGY